MRLVLILAWSILYGLAVLAFVVPVPPTFPVAVALFFLPFLLVWLALGLFKEPPH